jgi:signal transduction histidine kinase
VLTFETTSRRALVLYGALLVLPTLIFGWLYWSELQKDFDRDRAAIPEKALEDARKIVAGMHERLQRLIEAESARPFTDYARVILPEEVQGGAFTLQKTPLERAPTPRGLMGWFSFERGHVLGHDSPIRTFVGSGVPDGPERERRMAEIVMDFRRRKAVETPERRASAALDGAPQTVSLVSLAVSLADGGGMECVERCLPELRGRSVEVWISDFTLTFYRDGEKRPVAMANRRILPRELPLDAARLAEIPCLAALLEGVSLQQGFLLDTQWLFNQLAWDVAEPVLDEGEDLRAPPEALPIDAIGSRFAEIHPVLDLDFQTYYPEDETYGRLEIVIDDKRFEERARRQSQRFLATGGMLLLTLGIGMTLLYRSVRRELDQAHRMQNFVAAVTHELRTPISTIRLHAEMLQDGWVASEKQPEYYERIVRETQRLSTLVERVLEKSRLKENVTRPVAGDLNTIVESLREDFMPLAGHPADVDFELAPGLPPVWLTSEGVEMILSNLVENARKYAPASGDPILVRTRRSGSRILLEVLDRGPGVPAEEREKIFEAFYRIGSEVTRTTTGTGLGLHLVRLHAETCRADASVEERDGGGSIFRVAFRPAE